MKDDAETFWLWWIVGEKVESKGLFNPLVAPKLRMGPLHKDLAHLKALAEDSHEILKRGSSGCVGPMISC